MFKFVIVALTALAACVAAKPGLVTSPLAYANAPLYAAGGSSQVDIRNNYDGTLSSYANVPFGYAGPFASRYVAGAPAAYAAAPALAKYSVAAPIASPFAASPYAVPAAYNAAPIATAPFAASPFAAASPYFAAPYASPYSIAPAPVVV